MAGTSAARFSTALALALGIGIGGFFGSTQLAASTPAKALRTVSLRVGDVAMFGHVRCAAASDSRTGQPGSDSMRCSKRPRASARYWVDVGSAGVIAVGEPAPGSCT